MKRDQKTKSRPKIQEERQPLGVLLAEKINKRDVASMASPTTAYWTGGPDTAYPDPDA